jgi:hypothetical protein
MNFQSFSKSHLLFKTRFYWPVPETSVSIVNRSLVHEKHPRINGRDAMWSLGMDGGAARRNWAIPVGESADEGVEKVEGLTNRRFVAANGWENTGGWTAGGAQGAWPRSTSVRRCSGLEGARWCWEGWGSCVGLLGRHWTGRHELEEGVLGSGRTGSAPAQRSVQDRRCAGRPVRCLYRWARQQDAALIPQHGAGLGRRAQQGSATVHRAVRSSPYGVVRRCSRVPRTAGAKGTSGPRLEAVGNGPTRTPRRRGGLCTARDAASRWSTRRASDALERGRAGFSAGQRDFDCVFLQKVE